MANHQIIEAPQRRRITIRLSIIARQLRMLFDNRMNSQGVTSARWGLMAMVAAKPGSTQREIAATLEQSEASVGRAIDRLCNEGMLERRHKDEDKRAYAVFLTEKSRPMIDSLQQQAEEFEAATFAGFTPQELETLERLLTKMHGNL